MKNNHDVIGILGGTFDPIHFGHLRMGQEMLNAYHFDRIHFIPCHLPVHRNEPRASSEKRLAMLRLALRSQTQFVADERELKRAAPSYTIDTLLSLRVEMPQTTFCLLLGIDAFLHYPTWREPHKILELAHIIVAHRPNYQLPAHGDVHEFLKIYQKDHADIIRQQSSGSIVFQPITALDISAQTIRKQIESHQSPRYLLPDDVYNYIQTNQLYLTK